MSENTTVIERAVTTTDPALLSRYWIGAAGLGLFLSIGVGFLAALERLDLSTASIFDGADVIFQLWSAHRVGLVLLAVLPLILGLATAVVPRQVGASSLAFPRMAAAGFWVWLFGAAITVTGFAVDGGVGAPGATSQTQAVAITLVGIMMVLLGIGATTICVLTTVVAGRSSGMSLGDVPAFSWSMLVAGTMWMLTLPVLMGNLLLVYVDLRGRSAVRFGAEEAIWEQLSWAFTNPQVYLWALPLLGIVADIIPVSVKAKLNTNRMFGAICLLGFVGFGAYAQTYFDLGTPVRQEAFSVAAAFVAVLAMLMALGALAGSLRNGAKETDASSATPLVLAMLSLLLLLVGTVVGALNAVESLDLAGTSAIGAQMIFTLAAMLVGMVAGLSWWGDLVAGRATPQRPLLITGLLLTLGLGLVGVADLINGFNGLNDFTGAVLSEAGNSGSAVDTLNLIVVIGLGMALVGALNGMISGCQHLRSSEPAVANPWGGTTLEWSDNEGSA
ncbi:MAG: hypothetical protein HN567_05155 [Actinobacteria bacterium]|mgnify:FL=1|jgi:heme/copper-type cytochrome/quinol oxidase subunit 1|nr:hypothetical protein [Actinomycetota bacterium]MBT3969207.1 hypothetical protein [Actinomycetota bacterium]MBT4010334.1 hypothetical protein [Actinomycetota bacterium]MBT4304118.1 hypothetical protein [Actinomycetota bacterium]MBT4656350.1 hypothetical protein [Actinomycetota bacterium]